jgi:hypothetical protein
MSYKIKSLVYLVCFVLSIALYNSLENSDKKESTNNDIKLVQTDHNEQNKDLEIAM